MKQYPHILYKIDASGDSSQDGNGNYIGQTTFASMVSECREVPDGKSREVRGQDGQMYISTSIIFAPASCPDIEFGIEVYVRDAEQLVFDRIRGKVLRFHRGQLHCKIWL